MQPGPISTASLFWPPLADPWIVTTLVILAIGYPLLVLRLGRRGHRWPITRTLSWLGGIVVLACFTVTGFGRYAMVLFSAHMAQHLVLAMVAPILLVSGAPLTLTLRALPRGPGWWARRLALRVLHGRALRTLSHPVVALAVYVVGLYALYFSSLLGTLMRHEFGHRIMLLHFVLSGYLFYWVLVGTDPGRRPVPPPMLVLVHFAAMVFHAFLGVALMLSRSVIAADWFAAVHPGWSSGLLDDQHVGAGLAWGFGEIPSVAIMLLLVVRWIRADEREQRRLDRAADRAEASGTEDDLARYNEFLRRAAGR